MNLKEKKVILITTMRGDDFESEPISKMSEEFRKNLFAVVPAKNNRRGLCCIYNEFIKDDFRDCIILFAHSDLAINDYRFIEKIVAQMEKGAAVVGVAGTEKIYHQREESLWHWMDTTREKKFSGAVEHPNGDGTYSITAFGPYPKNVILLDGVLLAVDVEKVLDAGVHFDEQFSFHHYDLDFSLSCHFAGLKMSTVDSIITHNSPGLRSTKDPAWSESNQLFNKKWNPKIKNQLLLANH